MKAENANLPLKKCYALLGGGVVEGFTSDELVEALMNQNFGTYRNTDEFMFALADRCKLQNGSEIDCYNAETFIHDLVKYHFLTEVKY